LKQQEAYLAMLAFGPQTDWWRSHPVWMQLDFLAWQNKIVK
jgi:hypothetical protein